MSKRFDYYYRQLVTEAELDAGFDALEQADLAAVSDHGLVGIVQNAVVSEHSPTPDLTVDVSGAGLVYDTLGRRVSIPSLQTVNMAVDSNNVSTAVVTGGNEKWVSLYVKFTRALSDQRLDGNSNTVFFQRDESFAFVKVQGAEDAIGFATRPGLLSSSSSDGYAMLLADIRLVEGQTQILTADISTTRREDMIVVSGTPRSLRRGRVEDALSDLLANYNAHINATQDKHPATDVTYAGGGSWAGGSSPTNPATSVELQLDKIIADLSATATGASGTDRMGSAQLSGTATNIVAGTLFSQLTALKLATNIEYAGGGTWANGITNPATSAELMFDKIIADLGTTYGAIAIACGARTTWLGGRTNGATTAYAAIDKIITDLSAQTASDDGAERIGAESVSQSPDSLSTGSVRSQLTALLTAVNARMRIASAETVTANHTYSNKQTVNGLTGDTNAALETTKTPTNRALLWEWRVDATIKGRFYADNADQGFSLALGCSWNGSNWVSDNPGGANATRLFMSANSGSLIIQNMTNTASAWSNTAWTEEFELAVVANNKTLKVSNDGVTGTSGAQTLIIGYDGAGPLPVAPVGAVAQFRAKFAATPSSLVVNSTPVSDINLSSATLAGPVYNVNGVYVLTANTTATDTRTRFVRVVTVQ